MVLWSRKDGGHLDFIFVVFIEGDDVHGRVDAWELIKGGYMAFLIVFSTVVLGFPVGKLNEHGRQNESYLFRVDAAGIDDKLGFDHAVKISLFFQFN